MHIRLCSETSLRQQAGRWEAHRPFCGALHQRIGTINSCRCRIADQCRNAPETQVVKVSCPAGLAVYAARMAAPHEEPLFLIAGQVLPVRHEEEDLRHLHERLARLLKRWNGSALADAAMLTLLVEEVPERRLHAQVLLLQLFAEALRERIGEQMHRSQTSGHTAIGRALQFIEAHYRDDIRLGDAARFCSMSPSHFSRLFHRQTGSTYHQFLQERRVDSFKRLLTDPEMTIAEAANAAGFQSISGANRTFRSAMGCTPTTYRRAHLPGSYA